MTRLHLGCGGKYLKGYVNIDIFAMEGKVDRIFDLSYPLDYPDNSVEVIESYHLFEHLPYQRIGDAVGSWYRVLKVGSKLIMEMPDFDKVIAKLSKNPNDEEVLKYLFGSQDRVGQQHNWGWNKKRLQKLLKGVGFKKVVFEKPQDYHSKSEPCLRVEATK